MPNNPAISVPETARHAPVMLEAVLSALKPAAGEVYIDGTFGAGGYTRAILNAAACDVLAIDRDPMAIMDGAALVAQAARRLRLRQGRFSAMEEIAQSEGYAAVDGVVLDIGVSSMQLDDGARGFSFLRDGPLDMRMGQGGQSAADIVATFSTEDLADLIYIFGEEPKSRAIARAIGKAREAAPIKTTAALVKAIERATGPQRPPRAHPATRTFQALRIFVNGELDELAYALSAAERLLKPGGRLVVVTFHSLEDRIVKRFFAARSGQAPKGSRHAIAAATRPQPSFVLPFKGHIAPSQQEISINPRARSAKLRAGIRTSAAAHGFDAVALGLPVFVAGDRRRRH